MSRQECAQHEQAAEWFVTLQAQELSASLLEDWERWIADPDNRESFAAIVELSSRTETVGPVALPDPEALAADTYDGSESLATWFPRQLTNPHAEHVDSEVEAHRGSRRWYRRIELTAAAALGAITLIAFFHSQIRSTFSDDSLHYRTATAEHRNVTLADGSVIQLGALSTLRVRVTSDRRSVVIEDGEAFFDVAKDPKRPFVVQAGELQVTVVGTAFNVRKTGESVVVSVQEGTVHVAPGDVPNAAIDRRGIGVEEVMNDGVNTLTPGQQIRYDASGLSAVSTVNPELVTGWREGRLQYLYEPLSEVISDVNRYSSRRVLLDDRLRELRFTGTVLQANVDDFIHQLPDIFPLEIETGGDHITLRVRNQDTAHHDD